MQRKRDRLFAPVSVGLPRRPSRAGFTIAELVITVMMLALLVALAFPAVNRGLSAGKAAKCVANLKSIGAGLHAYIGDHGGDFPPCAALPNGNYKISFRKKTFWFDALNPYMGYPKYAADRNEQFPEPDVVGTEFPFPWQLCPAKQSTPLQRQSVGYGWNLANFGLDYSRAESTGFGAKISQIPSASTTIVIGDSKDAHVQPENVYQDRYIYDYDLEKRVPYPERHHGGGNYLFVDGHVEWIAASKMNTPAVIKLFKRKK